MQRPGHPSSPEIQSLLALPTAVQRKSVGRSLKYWANWLTQAPQGPYIKLRRALLSQDIPSHIVHHFVCDCIERTLSLFEHTGPSLPTEVREAFAAKRLWIEGRMSWESFQEQMLSPTKNILDELKGSHNNLLLQMLKGALENDPTLAALSSIYHPIFPQDRHWQCQRLLSHLQAYYKQLEHLVALLDYRGKILDSQHQHWQHTLEDALFEK